MKIVIVIVCTLILAATFAHTDVPDTFSIQGVLTDGGSQISDGYHTLEFRLYTASAGGSPVWSESQLLPVFGGVFSAILGNTTPLALTFNAPYWVGVTVDGGTELAPRMELTSTPYSLNIPDGIVTGSKVANNSVVRSIEGLRDNVDLVGGGGTSISTSGNDIIITSTTGSSPWTVNGSNIYRTTGNIGIGTTSPIAPLHLYANRDALFGSSTSGNGAKVVWDYSSRAFRAGYAAASSWNPDSIGLYSTGFGFGTVASAYMTSAHGFYTWARTYAGTSIGRYNVGAAGNATSWTTSDPLFEVGNGTSNSNRNNAFTIRKDGRVGINDATPDYMFDIENPGLSLRSIYINHDNPTSSSTMYGIYINSDNTASNSGVSYAGYFDMTNNNDDAYGQYSLAFCDAVDGSPAYAVRSYVDNDNGSGWAYSIYGSVSGSTTGSKYAGYFNGNVYTTGSYLPSDAKLKTQVQATTERATDRLMQLQVADFQYRHGEFPHMNLPAGAQTGLVAQDVELVYPELVHNAVQPAPTEREIEDGAPAGPDVHFKAVDYARLVPHLIKALQEQQAEIEELKRRLEAVER